MRVLWKMIALTNLPWNIRYLPASVATGVYIYLVDGKPQVLVEQDYWEVFSPLPHLRLQPTPLHDVTRPEPAYECPLYCTSSRIGARNNSGEQIFEFRVSSALRVTFNTCFRPNLQSGSTFIRSFIQLYNFSPSAYSKGRHRICMDKARSSTCRSARRMTIIA